MDLTVAPGGAGIGPTRERLIDAAAGRLARQGLAATGIKQILADAAAPFSSLYHHFPGGKEELAAEAIVRSGRTYGTLVAAFFDGGTDVVEATRAAFDAAAEHLVATEYEDACPIATVALEVSTSSPTLQRACGEVFAGWIDALAQRFVPVVGEAASAALATQVLVALEGAFVLAQALHDPAPLAAARDLAVDALRSAMDGTGS